MELKNLAEKTIKTENYMNTLSDYPKILLGKNNNKNIYLTPPSWDCNWYWGFGYVGNKDCHYHLKNLESKGSLYEQIQQHFGSSFILKEDSQIIMFCELVATIYALRETAKVFERGGSHCMNNPCKDLITNKSEVYRINNIVLPQLFEELYKLLARKNKKEKL